MVKCYKTKNLDSYYLEMGATEGFLKGEIKTLVDKLRDKEEEIKKLKSDLSLVIKERDDNIEQNKKLKDEVKDLVERNIELDKKYILVLAENKKLKANNEYWNKIVDIVPQDEKSVAEETIQDLQERNEKINAENRKLKKYYDRDKEELMESCYDLARENENLNARIKELEQCNLNLQTWIDNKEKVNKSMREELQRYKDMWDSGEF